MAGLDVDVEYALEESGPTDAGFVGLRLCASFRLWRGLDWLGYKVFTEPLNGVRKGFKTTERYRRGLKWACENFKDLKRVQRAFSCSALRREHYSYKASLGQNVPSSEVRSLMITSERAFMDAVRDVDGRIPLDTNCLSTN